MLPGTLFRTVPDEYGECPGGPPVLNVHTEAQIPQNRLTRRCLRCHDARWQIAPIDATNWGRRFGVGRCGYGPDPGAWSSQSGRGDRAHGVTMEAAFAGIRVLDISQGVSGSYCTKFLADFGADVVK